MFRKCNYLFLLSTICLCLSVGGSSMASTVTELDHSGTQKSRYDENKDTDRNKLLDEYQKITENESNELYVNPRSLAIRLVDKKQGQVLSSDIGDSEEMNDTWKKFMMSGITIEYMDVQGKLNRLPLVDSEADVRFQKKADGFEAELTYQQGISLRLEVRLIDNSVLVSIPSDSISETSDYQLQNVFLYPFMGATKGSETPGYLFVPDGSGALIRTDQKTLASAPYVKRIYGPDIGITTAGLQTERSMILPDEIIHMPVFGMVSGTGRYGYAAVIEAGSAYAEIQAYVDGVGIPYNFVTAKYLLRETYSQAQNQSGKSLILNQKERNQTDFKVSYTMLTGEKADYSGMSEVYRKYFSDQGMGSQAKPEAKGSHIPLYLELLASEQKDALFGKSCEVMTSIQQIGQIFKELTEADIENLKPVIRGFQASGASAAAPTDMKLESKVGKRAQWSEFLETCKNNHIELGFYADFHKAYSGMGGYQKKKDRVQAVNQSLLKSFDTESFYYLSPSYALDKLHSTGLEMQELGVSYMAVDTIGNTLYSDWNRSGPLTRDASLELYRHRDQPGIGTAYYRASDYLWNSAKEIYELPDSTSGYLIFTDTVPMLQMVLKGSIPYYGIPLNFQADQTKDLLRMAEYGTYPSAILTWEDPLALYNTPSDWLYSSKYEVWKDEIVETYHALDQILSHTMGAVMTEHEVLKDGVICTAYSNGGAVLVNYNKDPYQVDGILLDAESAVWVSDASVMTEGSE